jgi:hypothetical protein
MKRLEDTPNFQELVRLFQEMPPDRKRALLDYLDHESTADVVQGVVDEPDNGLTLSPAMIALIQKFQGLPDDKQRTILESLAHKSTTDVVQMIGEMIDEDEDFGEPHENG